MCNKCVFCNRYNQESSSAALHNKAVSNTTFVTQYTTSIQTSIINAKFIDKLGIITICSLSLFNVLKGLYAMEFYCVAKSWKNMVLLELTVNGLLDTVHLTGQISASVTANKHRCNL